MSKFYGSILTAALLLVACASDRGPERAFGPMVSAGDVSSDAVVHLRIEEFTEGGHDDRHLGRAPEHLVRETWLLVDDGQVVDSIERDSEPSGEPLDVRPVERDNDGFGFPAVLLTTGVFVANIRADLEEEFAVLEQAPDGTEAALYTGRFSCREFYDADGVEYEHRVFLVPETLIPTGSSTCQATSPNGEVRVLERDTFTLRVVPRSEWSSIVAMLEEWQASHD
jgi:hypothetical protein